MDTRDKQFDNWIKSNLNTEIMLSKQNRQFAWEQIHMKASQAALLDHDQDDFQQITHPIAAHEPLHNRVWQWVSYVFTHDISYQRAHDNSVQYYKAKPNYCSGLTLHDLEMMRHHWTCPV
jgi:hypothetical protein